MNKRYTWLWLVGAVALAAFAWSQGVGWGPLLLVAFLIACPAGTYFGMRGMHEEPDRVVKGPLSVPVAPLKPLD